MQLALQPVVGQGRLIKKETTAITYFQKTPDIRVIPYAPVALIGVPFTCTQCLRDLLAIPHEVGHYVFWRGEIGGKHIYEILYEQVPRQHEWCRRWREEVFADVYGCLLAGPTMALDFQDLMLVKSRKRFVSGDGTHPVPALRPYIYSQVLESMELGSWVEPLDKRWQACLSEREGSNKITTKEGVAIPLQESRTAVAEVVRVIENQLSPQRRAFDESWWRTVYSGLEPPEEGNWGHLGALYEAFEGCLGELPSERLIKLTPVTDIWKEVTDKISERTVGRGEIHEPRWVNMLRANGWATKGPNTMLDPGD